MPAAAAMQSFVCSCILNDYRLCFCTFQRALRALDTLRGLKVPCRGEGKVGLALNLASGLVETEKTGHMRH